MDPWIWAVLLLLVGLCLAAMDIFLPSGGIMAVLAACAIIASIVLAFMEENKAIGFTMLSAAVVGLPVVVVVALRLLPDTAVGRRFLLQPPRSEEVLPDGDERETLQAMVGRVGRAKTKMLPGGIVTIDNRTYDAISEGMPVEESQHVRVIEVRSGRLIVEGMGDPSANGKEEDPLARPIDWDTLGPLPTPPA